MALINNIYIVQVRKMAEILFVNVSVLWRDSSWLSGEVLFA